MKILELKPGTPIEFTIASQEESDDEYNINMDKSVYVSSVFGVTKKEEVIFHIPTRRGRVVTIPMDVELIAIFNTKEGMFQLTGKITKRGRLEKFPVYVFEPNSKLSKVQRRDYYRFNCVIPIKVLPVPEEVALLPNMQLIRYDLEKYGNSYGDPVDGSIVDISGGGARFTSLKDISTERFIYVTFKLVNSTVNRRINVIAQMVKSEYKNELELYEHRIEFLYKDTEDRETIIKYIFDEERRIRKNDQG